MKATGIGNRTSLCFIGQLQAAIYDQELIDRVNSYIAPCACTSLYIHPFRHCCMSVYSLGVRHRQVLGASTTYRIWPMLRQQVDLFCLYLPTYLATTNQRICLPVRLWPLP